VFIESVGFYQGEELRKLAGATYYIECSSKTQQVCMFLFYHLGTILDVSGNIKANFPHSVLKKMISTQLSTSEAS